MTLPHSRKSCAAVSDEKGSNSKSRLLISAQWTSLLLPVIGTQTGDIKYSHVQKKNKTKKHGLQTQMKLALQMCYLESVSAADVVIRLDRGDDITGQGDAAEHHLLSAVWKGGRDDRVTQNKTKKKQWVEWMCESCLRPVLWPRVAPGGMELIYYSVWLMEQRR